MKKLLLAFSFVIFGLISNAQVDQYQALKKIITETHPEINTENKLIAFNIWSVDNAESRETNKAFEKVAFTYQQSRLKGGSKGLIVVLLNKENLTGNAVILLGKDGISKALSMKLQDINIFDALTTNAVYDSNGNLVYSNLRAPAIFNSFNQLITR